MDSSLQGKMESENSSRRGSMAISALLNKEPVEPFPTPAIERHYSQQYFSDDNESVDHLSINRKTKDPSPTMSNSVSSSPAGGARIDNAVPKNEPSSSDIPGTMAKAKRKRVTQEQFQRLMQVFEQIDTPSSEIRENLANELGMTKREVQVWFQNRRAKMSRARAAAAAAAAAADVMHPTQQLATQKPLVTTTTTRIPTTAPSKIPTGHDLTHPMSSATSGTTHLLQPIAPMPLQRPIPPPPLHIAHSVTPPPPSSMHAGDKRPIAPRRPAQNRHSMAFPLDAYGYPNLARLDHPRISPTIPHGVPPGVQHSMANLTLQPRRRDSRTGPPARKRPKSAIDILAHAAKYVDQDSKEDIKGEHAPVR